jgi:ferredoxin/flavodoxin
MMSRVEIYYFSGTGNSLHVAKELQRRIPETKLIPMVSLLNQEVIETNGETIGLVFPIYLMKIPVPVKRFLEKLDFKSTKYIMAIATRGGSPSLANIDIEKILEKKGKSLDAYFSLNMPWNSPVGLMPTYIPGLTDYPATSEKISKLESEVQSKLDLIQKLIVNQEKHSPHPFNLSLKNLTSLLTGPAETANENKNIDFYADSACTGCGICEKVCLSRKIEMINEKPVWQQVVQCYFCYACFNFCPVQAILIKNIYTKKDGRYFHPEVTAIDIGGQK